MRTPVPIDEPDHQPIRTPVPINDDAPIPPKKKPRPDTPASPTKTRRFGAPLRPQPKNGKPIRLQAPDIVRFVSHPKWLNLPLSLHQETLLRAIYGLPMPTPEHLDIFRQCTGRATYVPRNYPEVTVISGARSGKDSRIAGSIAVYEACFGGHRLAPGERGVIPIVAQDHRAAKIAFDFVRTYLQATPACESLITNITANEVTLSNGLSIATFPCTVKSLRGWSIPCGVMDELAFFRFEGSQESDIEIQTSIRRGMINFARTKLVKISTPYLKSGVLYEDFQKGFGTDDPDRLVWRSTTAQMNPSITAERLERERRLDPSRYAREFEAEFRDDLEAFLSSAWIENAVIKNRHALPPFLDRFWYGGAIDSSGGGNDAFTCSICHLEGDGSAPRIVQDYTKAYRKPRGGTVDLEGIVAEIATTLKSYGITVILSDRYAGQWVPQSFARHGITIDTETTPDKTTAYLELEPVLAQGRLDLLDDPIQTRELSLLERHNRAGGKPLIDHPRGAHDDRSNALALSVYATMVMAQQPIDTEMSEQEYVALRRVFDRPGEIFTNVPDSEIGGSIFGF
jgi:hypothetical protein